MEGKLRNMCAIYIRQGNSIALLYRMNSRVVEPSWCGIGGHFEQFELNDARACVLRELQEEAQLTLDDLDDFHMRYVTLRLKNGEIRQNYYFFAFLKEDRKLPTTCDEGKFSWVDMKDVLHKHMPFTAKCMLRHYITIGQYTTQLYSGVSEEVGIDFKVLQEFQDKEI